MEQWAGVVLAAGQGQRMVSRKPKPLHQVCGKELIRYPVELLQELGIGRILLVVSPVNAGLIHDLLGDDVDYVIQPTSQGTGDAAAMAVAALPEDVEHLVMLGSDSPLIRPESVRQLVERHLAQENDMTMLTAAGMLAPDLGRVVRDEAGEVAGLVEASEWEGDKFAPAEVNAGVYCFNRSWLDGFSGKCLPKSQRRKIPHRTGRNGNRRGESH